MIYLITIKKESTYTVEASSRAEAYKLAKSRKAVAVGKPEEAISIDEMKPVLPVKPVLVKA